MSGFRASNRVLLTRLSVRTSGKGNTYLSGWLGKARVVAFMGEPDPHGNECWDVYLSEPEPRQDAQEAQPAPDRPRAPAPRPSEPPAARSGPVRRESAGSRQERAARDALHRYGDPDLNDAVDL